jgi:hypothetical protein
LPFEVGDEALYVPLAHSLAEREEGHAISLFSVIEAVPHAEKKTPLLLAEFEKTLLAKGGAKLVHGCTSKVSATHRGTPAAHSFSLEAVAEACISPGDPQVEDSRDRYIFLAKRQARADIVQLSGKGRSVARGEGRPIAEAASAASSGGVFRRRAHGGWGMKGEVLSVDHPLWEEFSRRLSGPEGCDFRFDAGKGYAWRCTHGDSRDLATAILRTMPGIDVEGTLAYFAARGCRCDCRIMFDAAGEELDDELH